MILSSWLLALSLEMSGDCVDGDRLLALVQQEIDVGQNAGQARQASSLDDTGQPSPELELTVTCDEANTSARFVLRRARSEYESEVALVGLNRDLRERTLALAVAEALPLMKSIPSEQTEPPSGVEEATSGQTAGEEERGLEPGPLFGAEATAGSELGSDGAVEEEALATRKTLESEALAGGAMRIYPSGVVMFGGFLGLRAERLGFSACLLSSGGTIDLYDSAYTNLSVGVSYALWRAGGGTVRGDWGARISGGYVSSDEVLRGYVGASGFGAADFRVTRTWRARVEAEVGHAGFSTQEELRHAQGLFFAASLSLGVGGTL